jgi:aspartate racemase
MTKRIGILGGMGPKATIYLFDQVVSQTGSDSDGGHIPVIVYNNPGIPDRTEHIINDGPSPLPALIEGAQFLEQSNVSLILMACVTAHYFLPEISKQVRVPFLHLIEETARYIKHENPELERLGLLATIGTIKTGIFQEPFQNQGIEIVFPSYPDQLQFMEAIYSEKGLKAGYMEGPKKILLDITENLKKQRIQGILAGCTEVPLALTSNDFPFSFFDPLKIGAQIAIQKLGYPLRES